MNSRLLIIALSVMSVTACTPEKVLNSIVASDTGHNLIGYEPAEEDQPITTPPKAAEPSSSSSVYVPPLTEPCNPGDFAFRIWSCGPDGRRVYI